MLVAVAYDSRIMQALSELKGRVHVPRLAGELKGWPDQAPEIRAALSRLREKGLVAYSLEGGWRLTQEGRARVEGAQHGSF